jgi:hypothetical protein
LLPQVAIGLFEPLPQFQRPAPVFVAGTHVRRRGVAVQDVVEIEYRDLPQLDPQHAVDVTLGGTTGLLIGTPAS